MSMPTHHRFTSAVAAAGLLIGVSAGIATAFLGAADGRLGDLHSRAVPAVRGTARVADRAADLSQDLSDLTEARYAGDVAKAGRLRRSVEVDFVALDASLDGLATTPDGSGGTGLWRPATVAGRLRADADRLRADWAAAGDPPVGSAAFARTLAFDDRASDLTHAAVRVQSTAVGAMGVDVAAAAGAVACCTGLSAAYAVAVVIAVVLAGRRFARRLDARLDAETRDVVIYAMARLAESRDNDTGKHVDRVQAYCQVLARRVAADGRHPEADAEFVDLMYRTSPLHDIGKVGVPDAVLLKPGKLTPAEFEVMKGHAALGARTLGAAIERFPDVPFLRVARDIAATHHERFDGTGYPAGLAGEAIPLCGRIVALADVYDALTTRRVYKPAFPHAAARDLILAESGRQFDPTVVAAFVATEVEFVAIRDQLSGGDPAEGDGVPSRATWPIAGRRLAA